MKYEKLYFFLGHASVNKYPFKILLFQIGCGTNYELPAQFLNFGVATVMLHTDGPVPVDVDLHDEGEQLVLGGVLAHGPHHTQQLLRRDGPAPILKKYYLRKHIYNNRSKEISCSRVTPWVSVFTAHILDIDQN